MKTGVAEAVRHRPLLVTKLAQDQRVTDTGIVTPGAVEIMVLVTVW